MNWFNDPSFIQRVRERLGLSQTELGTKAGLRRSMIADIETGRRHLSAEVRTRIWQALAEVELQLKAQQIVPLPSLAGQPKPGVPLSSLLGRPTREEVERELAAIEKATSKAELEVGSGR